MDAPNDLCSCALPCIRGLQCVHADGNVSHQRQTHLPHFISNRQIGVKWNTIVDFDAVGAHSFEGLDGASRFLGIMNRNGNRRIGWIRTINNRSTGDNLRAEYLTACSLFARADHLRSDPAHVTNAEHAVRDQHIELANAGLALEMLVHIPQTRNHKLSGTIKQCRSVRMFVVPTPMPDFANPAIEYDQGSIELDTAVHDVNDVHVGYHERCLCRHPGSQSYAYGNESE